MRIASLSQNTMPFRKVRDIVTIWDLQPDPTKTIQVSDAKWIGLTGNPLRYSADGATIVGTGLSTTVAIDAATGNLRCEVPTRVRSLTHLNAQGLSAGIASAGWQTGDLPRVMVWDTATCEIRSTLHADMELLQAPNVVQQRILRR